jgi:7,8-dihydropterin-6-yl-methyl-4-(beta-D-ribofuranosyl)aminobenzene 5'-phosphate synthase
MTTGGLLRAIKLINDARRASGKVEAVKVDLHPTRPDFRGFSIPTSLISLEADPSFEEIRAAGGEIVLSDQPHVILDGFLVSGEIPRKTAYEQGIRSGMRYQMETGKWSPDPFIMDERFLICCVEGETGRHSTLRMN